MSGFEFAESVDRRACGQAVVIIEISGGRVIQAYAANHAARVIVIDRDAGTFGGEMCLLLERVGAEDQRAVLETIQPDALRRERDAAFWARAAGITPTGAKL